ncbi:MAG: hypothetical protein KUG82_21885 [Pseudomonadales bacterium]|nr:hypothetical protein [Pseudomonadales bacterium]
MLDWYAPFNKHFIFPFYYWRNGDKRLARLAEIEASLTLSEENLNALQLKKMQTIVRYAYAHSVYYKKIMNDRHFHPNDLQKLSDIEALPVLTKTLIQNNLNDLISDEYTKDQLVQDASGGSTGEPTIYYKDWDHHNLRRADQIRHDRWSGWDIGKRSALIWGAQRDLKAVRSIREHIISRYIERRWELDAFEMTHEKMNGYTRQLEKIKPSMILGYANALTVYAQHLLDNSPNHTIRPEGIISSAETLTSTGRAIIESAFHCKVLNRYGSREVGLIASECKTQEGLHINADNVYVEILKEEKPVPDGNSGDIVVTDFWNFGMPFIRYKLEDVGHMKLGLCSCGRSLPLMGAVEGRTGDFFIAKNGSMVHGEYFTHLFYGIPEVQKFQMIQETITDVHLKIVETPDAKNRSYLDAVKSKTIEMLGEQTLLTTQFVKHIPPTASGKSLFTISKVKR